MKNLPIYLLSLCCLGAAPSRVVTYVDGDIIEAQDVTSNEDAIFAYLQAGVDTFKNGTIQAEDLASGVISAASIAADSVTTTGILNSTILSEDISDGTIVSADIADGTIVNADISSSAAIAFSKLGSLTSANILVGNSSNVVTAVDPAGDVEFSNAGATTIQDNSVDGTDIAIGSDAQGDVLYYDGTDWTRLGAGTSGQFLKTNGAAANPAWATVSGNGAWTFVETLTLTGTSVTSASLPTTNNNIMLMFDEAAASGGTLALDFNMSAADSTFNYLTCSSTALSNTASAATITLTAGATEVMGTVIFNRTLNSVPNGAIAFNLAADDNNAVPCVHGNVVGTGGGVTVNTVTITGVTGMTGEVHVFRGTN